MPALLGGFLITAARWISTTGLRVDFSTTYTDRLYQLYAGRTLIGVTEFVTDTFLEVVLQPSQYPQWLQLVAVEVGDQATDYGESLPDRPYNKVRLGFTTSFGEAVQFVRISASPTPGANVDVANVLENMLFDTDRAYTYLTPGLAGSGVWKFEAAGIDQAGNRGTPLAFTANGVLAIPPDIKLRGDGNRLTAAVADGVATLSFTYPTF